MRRTRFITFIIWVVALVAVWKIGQSSAFADSLFEFAASGAVPGTDVVLQPDQVMWLLGGLLGLAVLLIFGTNIIRTIRALYRRIVWGPALSPEQEAALAAEQVRLAAAQAVMPVEAPPIPSMPVMPAAAVPPPVAAAKVSKRKKAKPQPVIIIEPPKRPSRILLLLRVLSGTLMVSFRAQTVRIRSRLPVAAAAFQRGYARVRAAAARGAEAVRRAVVRAAIAVGRACIRAWRWAEPHLRTFDAWLGMHYNRGVEAGRRNAADLKRTEGAKIALGFTREVGKIAASARDQARSAWSRVAEK